MRKYISKQDLACVLHELLTGSDPEVQQAYREVILYRSTKDRKRFAHAAECVSIPNRIALTAFNIAVLLAGIFVLSLRSTAPEDTSVFIAWSWVLFGIALAECYVIRRQFQLYFKYRLYILIDELLARRIIILSRKSSAKTEHAKAAK